MFGWSSPRCPLDPPGKVWVDRRMEWLGQVFGWRRLREAKVVLPNDEYFPDLYKGTERDVDMLFERVCGFMGVDPLRVELDFYKERRPEPTTAGLYLPDAKQKVLIERSQLDEPMALVATMAHELAHVLLIGDERISPETSDHEGVTDLTMVFLGMGIFGANSAIRDWHVREGRFSWWGISTQGYMAEPTYGYAFGLFAWLRGEKKPDWERFLRPNVQRPMRESLDYLLKTNDAQLRQDEDDDGSPCEETAALEELVQELRTGSIGQRVAALWDLRSLGEQAGEATPAIVGAVSDPDPFVRIEALETLGLLELPVKELLPPLIDAILKEREVTVRPSGARVLGALADQDPERAIAALIQFLKREQIPDVQEVALLALQALGPKAEPAVPALQALIHQNEPQVEVAAISALAAIGSAAVEAVPLLIEVMNDDDGFLRADAAYAISCLGGDVEVVVPAFIQAVKQRGDPHLRQEALWGLGRLGAKSQEAIPLLRKVISKTSDLSLKEMAAWALAVIEDRIDILLPVLQEVLPPPLGSHEASAEESPFDESLVRFAQDCLGGLQDHDFPGLLKLLHSANLPDRVFAAWACGYSLNWPRDAIEALRQASADADRLVRLLATRGLWKAEHEAEGIAPILVGLLKEATAGTGAETGIMLRRPVWDFKETLWRYASFQKEQDGSYRACLGQMLGALGEPAVAPLLQAAANESTLFGEDAARILGAIALHADGARRSLEDLQASGHGTLRATATKALEHRQFFEKAAVQDRRRRQTVPPTPPLPELPPNPDTEFDEAISRLIHALSTGAVARPTSKDSRIQVRERHAISGRRRSP